ncbi:MAG: WD40/YVTN/BNR-like repeat-containing protein, partial [Acidobacteriota bacterium]
HQLEDYEPHVFRTRDAGKTWTEITKGLPAGVYVQTVKEDPERRGLLFTGTERSVFVSFDDGEHWQSLQLNLPAASMRDLAIHDDDLIVATHGRGFWVLDNITALRQIDDDMTRANAYLFRPANAFNLPPSGDNGTPMPRDEPLAENPPYGAMIDYYLKTNASGVITLEILDPSGVVIRRYASDDKYPPVDPNTLSIPAFWVRMPEPLSTRAGMHRWIWDLRPTPPPRPAGAGGGGFGRSAPNVLPGTYTVKLTVDGKIYTQPLVVKMDPRAK